MTAASSLRNPSLQILLSLCCGLSGLACKNDAGVSTAASSTRTRRNTLNVPFPIGAVVDNPPVRVALRRARWALVKNPQDPNRGLPQRVALDRKTPTQPHTLVVGEIIDTTKSPTVWRRARKIKESISADWKPGVAYPSTANDLRWHDVEPPGRHIWLIGAEGPCRARFERPWVASYWQDGEVLEISWAVDGCPPQAWAPVGTMADSVEPKLRWVEPDAPVDVPVDPARGWDDGLASEIAVPAESDGELAEHTIQTVEVGGLVPRPTQVIYTTTRPDALAPEAADDCSRVESHAATHLLVDSRSVDPVDFDYDGPGIAQLLGAIAVGSTPHALVFEQDMQGVVSILPDPPTPLEADQEPPPPQPWTNIEVLSGIWAEADVVASEYTRLPARCATARTPR